jgi:hypothetical protein
MSSSRITEIINPSRLRLGIKRAFTGTVNEVIGELFQNSLRAGARTIRITTDDRGFIYQDDGRGLLKEDDFETLIKLGESGWDHQVEIEQQPMGLGFTALLAQEEVESVTFSSNLLALTLDVKRWWEDDYAINWRENLKEISFPVPGVSISVTCSKKLTDRLVKTLTGEWNITRSPARGYFDLLQVTLDDVAVKTSVPGEALPKVPLIVTEYQNNRLVIGLHDKSGYSATTGLWINWYGQMIAVAHSNYFKAYVEVRRGRPVNPMAPSRRGIINDQDLQNLLDFIRDSLTENFTQKPASEHNPEALQCFYRVYPDRARKLPVFVAARLRPFELGGDSSNIAQLSVPEVFTYDQPPLLLGECVKVVQEDGTVLSDDYGLHTFLELTGPAYRVRSADESRLHIQHLWWKPGAQVALPEGYPMIFYGAGQWGFGTEKEQPAEWRDVGEHTVFTFNDASNWDVDDVDFTVGGANPQEFYKSDAWAGFDPLNDTGRSYEEMSESYGESCEREIRKIIGNAVPKNFSWDDLLRFVPEGQLIVSITPNYRGRRSRSPETVTLILSNGEKVALKLC